MKFLWTNDPVILITLAAIVFILLTTIQHHMLIQNGTAYNFCIWNIEMVNHTVTQHDIEWCSGLLQ